MAAGESDFIAREFICNDADYATTYGFVGAQFTNDGRVNLINPGVLDEPGGFDMDSITMYGSDAFSDPRCAQFQDFCSLVKIDRNQWGQPFGTSKYVAKKVPSPGDVAFVKRWCECLNLHCGRGYC